MGRLSGHFGAVYVKVAGSFTKVADVYDWSFSASTTVHDISIKGDAIERWIPSHASGVKFTAKRRTEGAEVFPVFVSDAATNASQSTWRLDLIDNNNSFTQITCNGYAVQADTAAPPDAADEMITIQIDDSYSYNV